ISITMRTEGSKRVRRSLKIRLIAFNLLTAFAIAACQPPTTQPSNETISTAAANPADCRTIQHAMGVTEVCGQPQRIVVLGPFFLEPLLALDIQPIGYGDHAVFHQGDYTDPSQQIPYLGNRITQPLANVGSVYAPSTEAILKLQPDLILGFKGNDYETLSRIAPTVLLEDRFDAEQNLRTIAQAVNGTEQAEQLLMQTQQQVTAARETFAALAATHSQVALLSSSELRDIRLANPNEPCGALIKALGFQFVFPPGVNKDEVSTYTPISLETLPQLNEADLVILLGHNFSDLEQLDSIERFEAQQLSKLKQAWEENAIAQSLDASQAGRVYFIPIYLCRGLPGAIGTELYLEELKEQLLAPN
ncbi:MAG: iron-siderophore ABC transporter substrate-binding protein, partial [Cyanobacteria bacterium P01_F01_bin.116]